MTYYQPCDNLKTQKTRRSREYYISAEEGIPYLQRASSTPSPENRDFLISIEYREEYMQAIKCGKMLLPDGRYAKDSVILIRDGKILEAGPGVKIPEKSEIYDAGDGTVTPGLIESHGHLAMEDTNEMTSPMTPDMDIVDSIDPLSPLIRTIRGAGFTSFCTLPGSSNLIGGIGAALKLKDADCPEDLLIPECRPLKLALGENPIRFYGKKGTAPGSRMGSGALLREKFTKARAYLEKKERGQLDAEDKAMENLASVLEGKRPVKIHCHAVQDMQAAVRLAEEFHFRYTLEHVTSGRYIADYLARHHVRCCVGPLMMQPLKMEMKDLDPSNPGMLEKAGVSFSLIQDAGWDTIFLPSFAGICTAWGLSREAAMRALTTEAAGNLGLEDRIGSLEKGKDADIAVFDGDPLENSTRCRAVWIEGQYYDCRKNGQKHNAMEEGGQR